MICDDCGCVDRIVEKLGEMRQKEYVRLAGLKVFIHEAEEAFAEGGQDG
jgi:hypothetical protein